MALTYSFYVFLRSRDVKRYKEYLTVDRSSPFLLVYLLYYLGCIRHTVLTGPEKGPS